MGLAGMVGAGLLAGVGVEGESIWIEGLGGR